MSLNKMIFFLQMLVISITPNSTYADLIITNNTTGWITEYVDFSQYPCSGDYRVTADPMEWIVISTSQIKFTCDSITCIGKITVSDSYNSAKTCSGNIIGEMKIDDLNTDIISSIIVYDSHYIITGVGTNHLSIRPVANNATSH